MKALGYARSARDADNYAQNYADDAHKIAVYVHQSGWRGRRRSGRHTLRQNRRNRIGGQRDSGIRRRRRTRTTKCHMGGTLRVSA
jgi:hypothetical protein